jgi:hypothetical protein
MVMPERQFKQTKLFENGLQPPSNLDTDQSLEEKLDAVVEQDTVILPAQKPATILLGRALSRLPRPIQHIAIMVLNRAQDPEPEMLPTSIFKRVEGSRALVWGRLPKIMLLNALAMVSLSYAYTGPRYSLPGGEICFWVGLLLMYVPVVVRLISPAASRFERISLLCVAGSSFFALDVVARPFTFADYDAFVHWRTTEGIALTAHLFSENPLIPASPFYPGLEIVTNALSTQSGLGVFNTGIIVVGIARLIMILSLFMIYERITRSHRIAGIAMIVYISNPHFLFFDALFNYETLALPLATFLLLLLVDHQIIASRLNHLNIKIPSMIFIGATSIELKNQHRWLTITSWLVLGAVVITHHMTDFVLDGFLLIWAAVFTFQNPASVLKKSLVSSSAKGDPSGSQS